MLTFHTLYINKRESCIWYPIAFSDLCIMQDYFYWAGKVPQKTLSTKENESIDSYVSFIMFIYH